MSGYRRNMWMYLIMAKQKFMENRGQIPVIGIIGCVILLVAYMTFPDQFHSFVRWIIDSLREAVDRSFSGYGNGGPPKDDGNLVGGSK